MRHPAPCADHGHGGRPTLISGPADSRGRGSSSAANTSPAPPCPRGRTSRYRSSLCTGRSVRRRPGRAPVPRQSPEWTESPESIGGTPVGSSGSAVSPELPHHAQVYVYEVVLEVVPHAQSMPVVPPLSWGEPGDTTTTGPDEPGEVLGASGSGFGASAHADATSASRATQSPKRLRFDARNAGNSRRRAQRADGAGGRRAAVPKKERRARSSRSPKRLRFAARNAGNSRRRAQRADGAGGRRAAIPKKERRARSSRSPKRLRFDARNAGNSRRRAQRADSRSSRRGHEGPEPSPSSRRMTASLAETCRVSRPSPASAAFGARFHSGVPKHLRAAPSGRAPRRSPPPRGAGRRSRGPEHRPRRGPPR